MLVAFFAAPLLAMVAVSLRDSTTGQYGIGNFVQVFTEKAYTDALFNSLTLTAIVTLASLALAYPLAYSIASLRSARLQRLALTFAVLPFWTSYVVRSYAWLLVLAPTGPLNAVLLATGLSTRRSGSHTALSPPKSGLCIFSLCLIHSRFMPLLCRSIRVWHWLRVIWGRLPCAHS
ncbi:ABC transporter permease [Acetobacter papayae]|uniref:ABC transporter permease n=1 Tax=Acetobacter papayae TaxID=1076592 RepID=UPI000A9A67EF|nr:hypothetical protein [Acetobacter papayae]